MWRFLTRLGLVALVLSAAVTVVFVVGMRMKSPRVQRAVRQMNKSYWNPRAMATAGTPGAYASIVHHVGRRSGRTLSTPVVPVETADGFVIALPYGPGADWVQNVLVAGAATIVHEGELYEVVDPEIVATDDAGVDFSPADRRGQRLFNVDRCLRVRRVGVPTA